MSSGKTSAASAGGVATVKGTFINRFSPGMTYYYISPDGYAPIYNESGTQIHDVICPSMLIVSGRSSGADYPSISGGISLIMSMFANNAMGYGTGYAMLYEVTGDFTVTQ